MLSTVMGMMPSIAVGKVLIQRDEQTALPKLFYSKLPPDMARFASVLLLDPMLATGGSACLCIRQLVERGVQPSKIIFVNVVSCPEGLKALALEFPEVVVVSGAVDAQLNEKKCVDGGLIHADVPSSSTHHPQRLRQRDGFCVHINAHRVRDPH